MSKILSKEEITIFNIAMVKAWNYVQEYNQYSGQVEEKQGGSYLREGYIDGFLAGFTHKLVGGDGNEGS